MKIKNKASLVLSILDCILAIVIFIMCIVDKRPYKLFDAFLMLFFSIYFFQLSIETEKQRKEREEELRQMAKLYGWDKEEEEYNDDERINELYKEAEDISNRAGEEKVK